MGGGWQCTQLVPEGTNKERPLEAKLSHAYTCCMPNLSAVFTTATHGKVSFDEPLLCTLRVLIGFARGVGQTRKLGTKRELFRRNTALTQTERQLRGPFTITHAYRREEQ